MTTRGPFAQVAGEVETFYNITLHAFIPDCLHAADSPSKQQPRSRPATRTPIDAGYLECAGFDLSTMNSE
jgi:hypothetical protein